MFGVNLSIVAILAGTQINNRLKIPGVRPDNVRFSLALAIAGFGQFALAFISWDSVHKWRRRFIHIYIGIFNLWAIGNGISWLVDMRSCKEVSNLPQ